MKGYAIGVPNHLSSSLKSYKEEGQTSLYFALFLPLTEATLIWCFKTYVNV